MAGELQRDVWRRFDHDPRTPSHRHLRASDRDRDVIGEVLTEAFAEGRLDRDELDQRQDQLRDARTLGELPALVGDLVSNEVVARRPSPALRQEAEAQYRQRLVSAFGGFLVPTLICWVVWLSVLLAGGGTGFWWPVLVTLGTAMGPITVLANGREQQVGQIHRRLEDEEDRREERRRRRLRRPPGSDGT